MMQTGSMRPVGRITCSVKTPPVRCSSHGPGVAETNTDSGRIRSHSSNLSGRLSMQEGRRKPYSARVDLRAKSPLNMPPICGTVTWLSSTISSALSGMYSNSVGGGSPGLRPVRSEEHTSELQSLMRISYAVFCLTKKKKQHEQAIQISIIQT